MELWARMLSGNFAYMTTSTPFRELLHAANLRHGTDGFTSPPKEGVLRIFSPLKNPSASAGFEPANLGTKGQHTTPRPPKLLKYAIYNSIPLHGSAAFVGQRLLYVEVSRPHLNTNKIGRTPLDE